VVSPNYLKTIGYEPLMRLKFEAIKMPALRPQFVQSLLNSEGQGLIPKPNSQFAGELFGWVPPEGFLS
jgi:hypothetical protein